MSDRAFSLTIPKNPHSCAVFSSPHSGTEYPSAFMATTQLDSMAIRSSEDAFVDELFSNAPIFGAPLLTAKVPRAFVDLNRAPDELDPALVRGARVSVVNPRIVAGLGVIPRVVGNGQVIRSGKISLMEAGHRLTHYYHPYHQALAQLIDAQVQGFGMAILIDCHSMPKEALNAAPMINGVKPDIVIGDRFGASSDRWVTDAIHDIFHAAGFIVARNAPFAGGYITQHYGRPSRNIHAVQIEINRTVYMDEGRIEKLAHFDIVRQKLSHITAEITALGPKRLNIAAE